MIDRFYLFNGFFTALICYIFKGNGNLHMLALPGGISRPY
jgi:hypothetical protein